MSETPTGTDRVELTEDERERLWSVVAQNYQPLAYEIVGSIVAARVQALTAERDDLRARLNAANARYRLDFAERNLNRRERDRAYAERDAARAELAAANTRCAELERRVESDMKIRLEVEKVLDLALGSEPVDGAGEGLASDVHLLAIRWSEALDRADALQATLDRVTALADEWNRDKPPRTASVFGRALRSAISGDGA